MAEWIDQARMRELLGCSVDEDPQQMRLINDLADDAPSQLLQAVKLQGEVDSARRLIWLLVHRLGGQVTLTEEEVASTPLHPPLVVIEDSREIIAEPYIARQGG